mmetsp:Transcript_6779/g.9872  ORF Transcript_6779/g.9872 Transcript_6779/m.9872 type:complete len:108 (-) Transcript_6779:53-376(-)
MLSPDSTSGFSSISNMKSARQHTNPQLTTKRQPRRRLSTNSAKRLVAVKPLPIRERPPTLKHLPRIEEAQSSRTDRENQMYMELEEQRALHTLAKVDEYGEANWSPP